MLNEFHRILGVNMCYSCSSHLIVLLANIELTIFAV